MIVIYALFDFFAYLFNFKSNVQQMFWTCIFSRST